MEKKIQKLLKKWEKIRGLSFEEKVLFAKSLAATPDQRWQMHENFLKSHGLYKRSERKKFGFK